METAIKEKVRNSGHQVVRDYIPADEAANTAEVLKFKLQRGSGGRPDFIPGPDHELQKASGRDGSADEALERALRAQSFAAREEWDNAVSKLRELNVADAVSHIARLPFAIQEMYLAAESKYGQRKGVLGAFGAPDPAVLERYEALLADTSTESEDK